MAQKSRTTSAVYIYARVRGRFSLSGRSAAGTFFCSLRSTGLIFLSALTLLISPAFAEKPSKKISSPERSPISKEEIRAMRDSEPNPLARHRLNQAMAKSGLSEGGKALIDSLQADPAPLVRQGAAQTLGNYIQEPAVVTALAQRLMNDSAQEVRYACALSLALSDTPISLAALEKAANDSDPDLRRQVAFSLQRHKSKKAKSILKKMRKDRDASVRAMAEVAR